MTQLNDINRRAFLRLAGGGITGLLAGSALGALGLNAVYGQDTVPSSIDTRLTTTLTPPDVEIVLRAVPDDIAIFPGAATRVWRYVGEVLQGDADALQDIPGSYLGPIFRVRKGQRVRIHFINELPEESIVHWHGLHVSEIMDGHPRFAIAPGETYVYDFQVLNRAGTYWYHPHPHGRTGPQVYNGLAGLFLVTDDEEAALDLPTGEYDVPLVLQDRTFDANNQLRYLPNGMMDRMMGFLGERILVNGQPDFVLPVATRAYRLRLLNGSNSRVYKLGWEDGTPLTVIGTDGGLLEAPVQRDYVVLGPAERVDLWVDFGGRPVGAEMRLQSLPFSGAEVGGVMGGGPARAALPNGSQFTVLRVRIEREAAVTQALPERLTTIQWPRLEDAINAASPRVFTIGMQHMGWTLNGRTFEMEGVASDEIVRLNTLEVWEFENPVNSRGGGSGMMGTSMGRGGGMGMVHPIHVHGLQFQILEREVASDLAGNWETVRDGHVDEGWKDVVLLMPGERVRLLLKFEDYTGLFLYHCHNLEHEDMGMMRNYRVEA